MNQIDWFIEQWRMIHKKDSLTFPIPGTKLHNFITSDVKCLTQRYWRAFKTFVVIWPTFMVSLCRFLIFLKVKRLSQQIRVTMKLFKISPFVFHRNKWQSYRFRTTWRWVNGDWIFILRLNCSFKRSSVWSTVWFSVCLGILLLYISWQSSSVMDGSCRWSSVSINRAAASQRSLLPPICFESATAPAKISYRQKQPRLHLNKMPHLLCWPSGLYQDLGWFD